MAFRGKGFDLFKQGRETAGLHLDYFAGFGYPVADITAGFNLGIAVYSGVLKFKRVMQAGFFSHSLIFLKIYEPIPKYTMITAIRALRLSAYCSGMRDQPARRVRRLKCPHFLNKV
jgi:hypothetical protein